MTEIKELDNKYIVIKIDDLDKYIGNGIDRNIFDAICKKIMKLRQKEGKEDNLYVVLNLDDEFDINVLIDAIEAHRRHMHSTNLKVCDIAVAFVNAILKTKEERR